MGRGRRRGRGFCSQSCSGGGGGVVVATAISRGC